MFTINQEETSQDILTVIKAMKAVYLDIYLIVFSISNKLTPGMYLSNWSDPVLWHEIFLIILPCGCTQSTDHPLASQSFDEVCFVIYCTSLAISHRL